MDRSCDPRARLSERHHHPITNGTDQAAKNPGNATDRGASNRNRAASPVHTNAVHRAIILTGRRSAPAHEDARSTNGTYAARNHRGCVASLAPSVNDPREPRTSCSSMATLPHMVMTTVARPTRPRTRLTVGHEGEEEPADEELAAAHPAATKNTGIGDASASHRRPGSKVIRFAPRTRPSGPRSMTARHRCPETTNRSEPARARSIAPRRGSAFPMGVESRPAHGWCGGTKVPCARVSRGRACPSRR